MAQLDRPGVGARRAAIFALALWREQGTFPTRALATAPDHAFALELTGCVLRHKASLEWLLKRCANRLPGGELWAALMVGAAQLFHLPAIADYAAIAETVEAAKPLGRGAAGFVNAILRRLQRERAPLLEALSAAPEPLRRNIPPRLWTRWVEAFGLEHTRQLAETIATPPRVYLRPLPPHPAPATCEPSAEDPQGTFAVPRGCRVNALPGFAEGHFVVQDPATRHAIELLDIRPGQAVLDLCAAPGGKTAQIAARLFAGANATGRLVANEVSPERLETLRDTLTRCGFAERIRLTTVDGTQVATALPGETFDRILLDVPCSNTGVLGRRADARWGWSVRKLEALCQTQAALLEACAPLLRPGGRLVYSTCSIEPEEDAQQVERFLATHPTWHCPEQRLLFPEANHDGAFAALLMH